MHSSAESASAVIGIPTPSYLNITCDHRKKQVVTVSMHAFMDDVRGLTHIEQVFALVLATEAISEWQAAPTGHMPKRRPGRPRTDDCAAMCADSARQCADLSGQSHAHLQ